jgi:hypothetical protein
VSWLLVAAISFFLVWPYGVWLVVPLAAYGLAWGSYRGALHAAAEYGYAVWVLVDLNHQLVDDHFATRDQSIDMKPRRSWISAVARRSLDDQ